MGKKYLLILMFLGIILILGGVIMILSQREVLDDEKNQGFNNCLRKENCCILDEDCEYSSFVGVCAVPDYVNIVMEMCQNGTGPCPSEIWDMREATCTCIDNRCITHWDTTA